MKLSLYKKSGHEVNKKSVRILSTLLLGLIIQACSKHKISSELSSYSEVASQNQQISQNRTPTSDSKEVGQQNSSQNQPPNQSSNNANNSNPTQNQVVEKNYTLSVEDYAVTTFDYSQAQTNYYAHFVLDYEFEKADDLYICFDESHGMYICGSAIAKEGYGAGNYIKIRSAAGSINKREGGFHFNIFLPTIPNFKLDWYHFTVATKKADGTFKPVAGVRFFPRIGMPVSRTKKLTRAVSSVSQIGKTQVGLTLYCDGSYHPPSVPRYNYGGWECPYNLTIGAVQ